MELKGGGIHNSEQAGDAIWDRNVGCNEATRKTDWGERNHFIMMVLCMYGVTRKTRSGTNISAGPLKCRRLKNKTAR